MTTASREVDKLDIALMIMMMLLLLLQLMRMSDDVIRST